MQVFICLIPPPPLTHCILMVYTYGICTYEPERRLEGSVVDPDPALTQPASSAFGTGTSAGCVLAEQPFLPAVLPTYTLSYIDSFSSILFCQLSCITRSQHSRCPFPARQPVFFAVLPRLFSLLPFCLLSCLTCSLHSICLIPVQPHPAQCSLQYRCPASPAHFTASPASCPASPCSLHSISCFLSSLTLLTSRPLSSLSCSPSSLSCLYYYSCTAFSTQSSSSPASLICCLFTTWNFFAFLMKVSTLSFRRLLTSSTFFCSASFRSTIFVNALP